MATKRKQQSVVLTGARIRELNMCRQVLRTCYPGRFNDLTPDAQIVSAAMQGLIQLLDEDIELRFQWIDGRRNRLYLADE